MKKFPWKSILIGAVVLAILVVARCIATVCMIEYYGGTNGMEKVWSDPWTYIGMAAVGVAAVSAIMCLLDRKK